MQTNQQTTLGTIRSKSSKPRKSKLFVILMVLTIIGLIGFSLHAILFYKNNNLLISIAKQKTEDETNRVAAVLDAEFKPLMLVGQQIAKELNEGSLKKDQLVIRMQKTLAENPKINGVAIAYQPYKFDPAIKLYSPYIHHDGSNVITTQIESIYDYSSSQLGLKWFQEPLKNGPGYIEPYFGGASKALLAAYSIPFYEPEHQDMPLGVITVNYTLKDVAKIMASLDMGQIGYGSIISKTGIFAYHPNEDYVNNQTTIFELADILKAPKLKEIGKTITQGKSAFIELKAGQQGRTTWRYYKHLPTLGWSIETVFMKAEVENSNDEMRKNWLLLTLELMLVLIGIFSLLFRNNLGTHAALWKISIFSSLLMTAAICVIWGLALNFTSYNKDNSIQILDKASLNKFTENYVAKSQKNQEDPPLLIPTGILINSLKFETANEIHITGFVWQKYTQDFPEESRGVVFPEAISSEFNEAYKTSESGMDTVGWSFDTVIREPFSYKKYPLDTQDSWIRMWAKDFHKNIVLTPDLPAYKSMDPEIHPGVMEDIVVSGLQIKSSFFSYVLNSYNTNYGISNYSGQTNFPELYFTVLTKRIIFDPLLTYVLPLILIAFILFAVQMMISKEEHKNTLFGVNPSVVLATSSGLFFAVLVAHTAIRSSFEVNQVLYIEYFAFTLYFIIMLVTINSYLFSLKDNLKIIQFGDNLIPKLTFWPIVLIVLLIVTAKLFY
jgi:hypothetical protein